MSANRCPSCGSAVTGGNFCATCGVPLREAKCPKCGTASRRGDKFCNECGTSLITTARPARGLSSTRAFVTTIAAAAAVLIVVAWIVVSRGPRSETSPSVEPAGAPTAPDISALSPRERAGRLYDRIMRLHEQGKADSVSFFAPMALASYAAIADIDADARYDMARIALVSGAVPTARAQADTILRRDSTHLLGLLLAADLARAGGDAARAVRLEATFVQAAPRERQRKLPEYDAHGGEIESALTRLTAPPRR